MKFLVLAVFVVGCTPGVNSYGPADTKKLTEADIANQSALQLCQQTDSGMCRADQVRALSEYAMCKTSSVLFAHGQPIPNDAGGDCRQ